MKFKNVYTLFFLIALAVVWQGRSSGPGTIANLEVTGAPGSTGDNGTCGNTGCHTAGAFDPSVTITLEDMDGSQTTFDEYVPGQEYLVRVSITANNGNPAQTGFQAVALDDNDANAGAWNNTLSSMQTTTLSGREYLEHSAPMAAVEWGSFWVAPPMGSGPVTIYAAGLATNDDGGTGGDGVGSSTLTIAEAEPSSISQIDQDFASINIAPNPIVDGAKVTINSQVGGDFQLSIINVNGQKVLSENIKLQVGQNDEQLNLVDLQSGIYFLQLLGDNQMTTQQLIKL